MPTKEPPSPLLRILGAVLLPEAAGPKKQEVSLQKAWCTHDFGDPRKCPEATEGHEGLLHWSRRAHWCVCYEQAEQASAFSSDQRHGRNLGAHVANPPLAARAAPTQQRRRQVAVAAVETAALPPWVTPSHRNHCPAGRLVLEKLRQHPDKFESCKGLVRCAWTSQRARPVTG